MAKVKMPNGNGGYVEVEAEAHPGKTFPDPSKKIQEEAEKAAWERIGKAAENFNGYHKLYGTDYALETEELIGAMYLELLNWREFYPADLGGVERFDQICKQIADWFNENKNK